MKEIGTYEVEYNKQLRGQESEAFPTIYLKKKPQNNRCFVAFFFSIC